MPRLPQHAHAFHSNAPMRTLIALLTLLAVLVPAGYAAWRLAVGPACRAVFLRNFTSYFTGLLGYLFIVVFVVAASLAAFGDRFFANNLATLDQLSAWFPYLLLFLVPAITMTAWADERKLGTEELLFTLPASDGDILIGKYLAVLGVYTTALAFSLANVAALWSMGVPDWGAVFTAYLGYWLAGAALLAAGMLASALASGATVAFVLGAVFCAVPVLIVRMPRTFLGLDLPREGLASLGLAERLQDFTLGIVPLDGVAYFVSLAAFMLYLNYVVIRRRHWAGGTRAAMGAQYAIRAVSVAAALVGLNVLASNGSARADLTQGDLYSLAPATRRLLDEMDPKRPVTIQAFLSPDVPREFVAARKRLVGLLRQYDERAGATVEVRLVDVLPYSEQAREARTFGVRPFRTVTERDGRRTSEDVFLGLVVSSSYDEVVLPSLGPGSPLEYELTRAVGTVAKAQRRTVGVLQTDANLIGGQREWQIVRELRLQYEVEAVSPDAPIDARKYDVLLAVMPSSLTEPQMTHFLDYVKAGRPTLVFDDPFPMTLNQGSRVTVAPTMPKPRPGGMFGQMNQAPAEPKADDGRLTALARLLKISWTPDAVLWDAYNPHLDIADLVSEEFLFVRNRAENRAAIDAGSPITRGLDEVFAAYAGEVQTRRDSPYEFTPLLVTGPTSGLIGWSDFVERVPFDPTTMSFDVAMVKPDLPHHPDDAVHAIAARVHGKDKADPNVVFVADVDLITDWFFDTRLQNADLRFDNVTFVLNAVDVLAGDKTYLDLRSRRAEPNTLSRVEAATAPIRKRQKERGQQIDEQKTEKRAAIKRRFDARRAEIAADKDLTERAKAEQAKVVELNESLQLAVADQRLEDEANERKEQSKSEAERRSREVQNEFRLAAVLLPPILPIVLGIGVLLTRWAAERREIDPGRTRRA